jgi:hypothetical protein
METNEAEAAFGGVYIELSLHLLPNIFSSKLRAFYYVLVRYYFGKVLVRLFANLFTHQGRPFLLV